MPLMSSTISRALGQSIAQACAGTLAGLLGCAGFCIATAAAASNRLIETPLEETRELGPDAGKERTGVGSRMIRFAALKHWVGRRQL
jgi:hypothetical protein